MLGVRCWCAVRIQECWSTIGTYDARLQEDTNVDAVQCFIAVFYHENHFLFNIFLIAANSAAVLLHGRPVNGFQLLVGPLICCMLVPCLKSVPSLRFI